jgi:hypothetical protein
MSECEVIGRPFRPGNHPTHDMAAAGRKGKANSPWRKGMSWLGGGGTERERIDRAQALPRNRGNNHA